MTLTELFETFRESAFRLEALQHYVLEEDEPRRQAFRAGHPLPPRPGKIESMRLVRNAVAAGKRVHRVHVVELPLTEYLRYELAVYRENIAAGEDVRIADRAAHRGLRELDTDFWVVRCGDRAGRCRLVPLHREWPNCRPRLQRRPRGCPARSHATRPRCRAFAVAR